MQTGRERRTAILFSATLGFAGVCALQPTPLWADYEVPNSAYNPPTHYYDEATSTGWTLRVNLRYIISGMHATGGHANTSYPFHGISYGNERYAMGTGDISPPPSSGGTEDIDPGNSSNILLAYNRASVSGKWDAGTTWNREHTWPKFWLNLTGSDVTNSYLGVASDAFELRPTNPGVNSSRLDYWYGFYNQTGSNGTQHYGTNTDANTNTTYWYPGDADRGEVARGMFYMATRYLDPNDQNRTSLNGGNLELVNGPWPNGGNSNAPRYMMGDLNSLLHWNYMSGVDNFERRRNQYIFGSSGDLTDHALNSTYYQNNRNPYIDHPEYVWAIWGTSPNNAQLYIGGSVNADGTSSQSIDLGRVIRNSSITATATATLTKTGGDPTTLDITTSGGATSTMAGTGQPMDYGNQAKNMTVGLSGASTANAGIATGTILIRNTDLTSSGAGKGSADGNDTVTLTATVVDHSNASFSPSAPLGALSIDFGYVPQGFAARSSGYNIYNLNAASNFTANLDLKSVSSSGNTGTLNSNVAATFGITPNTSRPFSANLTTGTATALASTYTITPGDEAIPGATNGSNMTLTLNARVISSATFPVTGFMQLNTGETYTTGPFSIASSVALTKTGPGTLTISGAQSNGAGSSLICNGGTTNINTDAGSAGSQVLALSSANAGTAVNLNATQHLDSLSVASSSVVTMPAGRDKTLVTNGLSISGSAKLDLNDNFLIVSYGSETTGATLASIRSLINTGRGPAGFGNATWTGAGGITSSYANANGNGSNLAIGYADNAALASVNPSGSYTSFGGEVVASNAVLVCMTRGADANLDGAVNGQDVTIVGNNFGKTNSGHWYLGDFDYNGMCDGTDVSILGTTFGKTTPTLSPAQLSAEFGSAFAEAFEAGQVGTVVPEPGSLGIVSMLGAGAALVRRRKRR